ncbi:Putative esterase [Dokdonia pacifica]|uniref:Putative esterase n=1 Tax=Dokdonia pacifica TaxID=1627892 RepID=A0A238ZKH8_9FLAO|nr:Putative esterase [Dokdonia pacifica]
MMRLKTKLFLFIFFCITISVKTQNTPSENSLGLTRTIPSTFLEEHREIKVYTPDSYSESDKKYPVLFILDGQRLFPYGVSLLKSFTQFKQTPEFIVVGITNTYPHRFGHFSDSEKKFSSFIKEEVLPFIDTNYRTSSERLLFGWEYGGSFVIQTLLDTPELFNGYMAASPFPIAQKIDAVATFLQKHPTIDRSLYFSVSPHEGSVNMGTEKLDSLLQVKAPKSMHWTYKKLADAEHRSTPYMTLYKGITQFYHYYPELQFNTLEEYTKAGGLEYVYDYYKQRSEQFGFQNEVSEWTKFTLIRSGIREENYTQFDYFMTTFSSSSFIENLRGSRPYEITDFYIKHSKYAEALDIYKILLHKRSDSQELHKKIGDTYTALDMKKEAAAYYKKAQELSEN